MRALDAAVVLTALGWLTAGVLLVELQRRRKRDLEAMRVLQDALRQEHQRHAKAVAGWRKTIDEWTKSEVRWRAVTDKMLQDYRRHTSELMAALREAREGRVEL